MRVRRSLTIGFLLLAVPHPAAADEAVLTDGRRLTGSLTLAKVGRLFSAAG